MKKRQSAEEIIAKLRQVDVLLAQKWSVLDAVSALNLTPETYYRWQAAYGAMKDFQILSEGLIESSQLKRLQELEAENALLRKAVSDLMLEKTMLSKVVKAT